MQEESRVSSYSFWSSIFADTGSPSNSVRRSGSSGSTRCMTDQLTDSRLRNDAVTPLVRMRSSSETLQNRCRALELASRETKLFLTIHQLT